MIRPLAREARSRAGGQPSTAPPVAATSPESPPRRLPPRGRRACRADVPWSVSGTVSGGGAQGPGGAVIWLKRVGGETPRPAPARGKVITQRNKTFIPRVLAVPVGTQGQLSKRGRDLPQRLLAVEAERLRHRPVQAGGDLYADLQARRCRPDPVQHPLVDAGLRLRGRLAVLRAGRQRGGVHHQGCPARRLRDQGVARGDVEDGRAASVGGRERRARRLAPGRRRQARLRSSSPTSRASRASPTSAISRQGASR